jgi:hypothetical protein
MSAVDDLAVMAGLLGVHVSRGDLERWAPLLRAILADLERLRDLPIDDREPAFVAGRLSAPPAGDQPAGG